MGSSPMSKGLGLVIARMRDAGLPGKPMLEVGGVPLWKRAVELLKASGVCEPILLGSDDPSIVRAAADLGCSAHEIDGIGALGGLDDGALAAAILQKHEAVHGPVDLKEVVAIPDIGAVCLLPTDVAGAVGFVWSNPPFQGGYTTSVCLPVYLINYRKGQRVMWHESRTKLNRKGTVINGALYVARAGYLKETNSLIVSKGAIFPLPKQRAIVASDPWDFLSAKSFYGEIHGSPRG